MTLDRHLEHWSADDLAHLFEVRPDLLAASDRGLQAVARKATSVMSLGRALVRADVAMIVVAEALIVRSPATVEEIAELLGVDDTSAVLDAAERLRRAGIVTAERGLLQPVERLGDLLHRPLGLGRSFVELAQSIDDEVLSRLATETGAAGTERRSPLIRAVAARLGRPEVVARLLADAPADALDLVAELVAQRVAAVPLPAGFPYREPDRDDPRAWLLAAGLLVPVTDGVAEAPRELIMARLPDGLAPKAMIRAPTVEPVAGLAPDLVSGAASSAANRALDGAEALLRRIDLGEVSIRKAGGVGPKELRRLAKLHAIPTDDVTRLLELLDGARLIQVADGALRPSDVAADWWRLDRSRRWLILVRAWLGSERFLSRGLPTPDDDSQRSGPVALGDGEPLAAADQARRLLLGATTDVPPGSAFELDRLFTVAVWRGPNLWGTGNPEPEVLARWTVDEAELLGLVAHHAPSPVVAPLLAGDEDRLRQAATGLLSDDQETLVLQGDLTAVSFGPLAPGVARPLGEMTERDESDGSGPVVRFTERSIRSALDRGWTVESITAFLSEHALSGLPQPLEYLLQDVERRYGSVRVMPAQAVIVTADEATSVEIASTRRATRIGLRLIAPTVLTSPLDPVTVVEELRAEGLFPVLDGSSIVIDRAGGPDDGDGGRGSRSGDGAGFPADWTGPALPTGALAQEIEEAVAALMDERAEAADDGSRAGNSGQPGAARPDGNSGGDRGGNNPDAEPEPPAVALQRSWNRPVIIDVASDGGVERLQGIVVGLGAQVAVLTTDGVAEIDIDAVIGVHDPGLA